MASTQERVDIVVSADTYAGKKLLEDLANSFNKIGQSGEDSANKTGSAFGRVGAEIGRFALGMAGAATIVDVLREAVKRLRAEYDQFIQRATKAADAQLEFADAERQMANVLGDMDRKSADARLLAIASRTGVKPAQLALATGAALSGKGETLPDAAAFAAIEQAAAYAPGPRTQASTLQGIASTILMMQKDDPKLSARDAMSFISNAMRADRSESIEQFSQYLLPSIITAKGYGSGKDDMSFLASMGIGIGQRAEDPSGQTTATAFNVLLRQMKLWTVKDLGPNASVEEQYDFLMNTAKGTEIRRQKLGGFYDGDLAAIQGNGDLADRIGKKLLGDDMDFKTGKGRMLIPLLEVLQEGDTPTKRMIAATRSAIPSPHDPRGRAAFDALQAQNAENQFQQTAAIEMAMSGANQGLMLPNTRGGAVGYLTRHIPETLQASGVSKVKQDLVSAEFAARAALADDPAEVIDAGIHALRSGLTSEFNYGAGPGGGGRFPAKLSPEEKETNALLRELIDKLSSQKITIESGGEEQRGRIAAEGAGK